MARVWYPGLFPFIVPVSEERVGSAIGLTLDEAMLYYWRVQSWEITVGFPSAQVSGTNHGGHHTELTVAGGSVTGRFAHQDEFSPTLATYGRPRRLPGGLTASGGHVGITVDDPNPSIQPTNDGIIASIASFNLFSAQTSTGTDYPYTPPLVYSAATQLFYPNLWFEGTIATFGRYYDHYYFPGPSPNQGACFISLSWPLMSSPNYFPQQPASLQGSFDGKPFTYRAWWDSYLDNRDGNEYRNQIAGTLNASQPAVTITPKSYFPFQGRDGVPLFDAQTGAPAKNPATGKPFTREEIVAKTMLS